MKGKLTWYLVTIADSPCMPVIRNDYMEVRMFSLEESRSGFPCFCPELQTFFNLVRLLFGAPARSERGFRSGTKWQLLLTVYHTLPSSWNLSAPWQVVLKGFGIAGYTFIPSETFCVLWRRVIPFCRCIGMGIVWPMDHMLSSQHRFAAPSGICVSCYFLTMEEAQSNR